MNRATRIIVTTLGILIALSGMNHGFFETLQGNTPTNGLIIKAIGEEQMMWAYGGEEAFTIVPNYLLTGILAIIVSIGIIIWTVGFIHRKHGPIVFLLLSILLFLVGGGIGQIIFFSLTFLLATRINKPLTFWRKVLPEPARKGLAKLWALFLILASLLFFIGLFIAITGFVPGVTDPERILNIDWSILGLSLLCFVLASLCGFAYDIEKQDELVDDGLATAVA